MQPGRYHLQVVIFVKSVQRAKALNALLNECNFPSVCIHRGMDQKERINVYSQFKENKVRGRAARSARGAAAGSGAGQTGLLWPQTHQRPRAP